MNLKQVIVVRRDLRMRRGKEIAQCAHASMAFITRKIVYDDNNLNALFPDRLNDEIRNIYLKFKKIHLDWLHNSFKKVTVRVNSEQELLDIHAAALDNQIESHLVKDNALTEFKEPTYTCCAIGPDEDKIINEITGHLELY